MVAYWWRRQCLGESFGCSFNDNRCTIGPRNCNYPALMVMIDFGPRLPVPCSYRESTKTLHGNVALNCRQPWQCKYWVIDNWPILGPSLFHFDHLLYKLYICVADRCSWLMLHSSMLSAANTNLWFLLNDWWLWALASNSQHANFSLKFTSSCWG